MSEQTLEELNTISMRALTKLWAARESHVTEMEKANHTVDVLRGRQADERAALAILGILVNEIPSFNPEDDAIGMVSYTAGGCAHGSAVEAAEGLMSMRSMRHAMERELAVLREEVATFRGGSVGGGDVQPEAEAEPDNDPDGDHACEDLRGVEDALEMERLRHHAVMVLRRAGMISAAHEVERSLFRQSTIEGSGTDGRIA